MTYKSRYKIPTTTNLTGITLVLMVFEFDVISTYILVSHEEQKLIILILVTINSFGTCLDHI